MKKEHITVGKTYDTIFGSAYCLGVNQKPESNEILFELEDSGEWHIMEADEVMYEDS